MPDVWIQLENRPWDTMPKNIDRLENRTAKKILGFEEPGAVLPDPAKCDYNAAGGYYNVPLTVLQTGATIIRRMYAPLLDSNKCPIDALIFRRYKAPDPANGIGEWQVPEDRKVNPWDMNESNPTDTGTMGTIPGPVIECNLKISDTVIVHFRNADFRANKTPQQRAHSMHVHGFVFKQQHDGAFPLSQADPLQPIPASETTAWSELNVNSLKRGDRVPAGGTFNYTWKTVGWPSTAGVWLYHDHSYCDMENINLGAIGMVVIHNTDDANDFIPTDADFPGGNVNGSPTSFRCIFTPPITLNMIPQNIGIFDPHIAELLGIPPSGASMEMKEMSKKKNKSSVKEMKTATIKELSPVVGSKLQFFDPDPSRLVQKDDIFMHLNKEFTHFIGSCSTTYRTPPAQAQYLQLYHRLNGSPGMNINGRTYLGNTPSVVAGTNTKMRFGVVGMGDSISGIHTFHIHGHRWVIPGPSGTSAGAIQGSTQNHAVSQFEDTRIFGPANSFVFTIEGASGSFMRAGGPSPIDSKGEWHMHCHVLNHMMDGMMGSLIIAEGGDQVVLNRGEECKKNEDDGGGMPGMGTTIVIKDFEFSPSTVSVASGSQITFDFQNIGHTVQTISNISANPITITKDPGGDPTLNAQKVPVGQRIITALGSPGGKIKIICGIHGGDPNTTPITQMAAIITIL